MINPPVVDTHAHVWDRTCAFVPHARHRPDYEAPLSTYMALLDAHHIEKAVMVQPSFLGTDNSYMMAAATAHPDRLRAIVVVDPEITDAELDDLAAAGAIGLRYNMIGRDPALVATPEWRDLTERAAHRGWWIEIHAAATDWLEILPPLSDAPVMIAHFGRPSGPDCAGLAAILDRDPARACNRRRPTTAASEKKSGNATGLCFPVPDADAPLTPGKSVPRSARHGNSSPHH